MKFSDEELDELERELSARVQRRHTAQLIKYWADELRRLGPMEPVKWWDILILTDRALRNNRRKFAGEMVTRYTP